MRRCHEITSKTFDLVSEKGTKTFDLVSNAVACGLQRFHGVCLLALPEMDLLRILLAPGIH